MITEPQPWSIMAKGGKRIDKSTRQKLKIECLGKDRKFDYRLLETDYLCKNEIAS